MGGGDEVKKSICFLGILLMIAPAGATDQKNSKETEKKGSQIIDSGSFGIFIAGKRVGTESFKIEQGPEIGTITAEIKVNDGDSRAEQSSEMQIGRDGTLRSYRWHSNSPEKADAFIEAKDQLLVEHLTPADQKKTDVPHVLPSSTVILDDNFFSHREVLIWRYLATGCLRQDNRVVCDHPSQFGILVPHQHAAGTVTVQLLGRDKIMVKGVEQELNKIKLDADGVQWLLWVTDPEHGYKVIKMAIPADQVEVIRD
ncbi:MAG: hypothetical protein DMG65_19815 [Candidatus Angelobacter sp. Gp1-AA117]|nr:MAG: hypothetical protein DMG65_19815 [Candidatus Angelobacter sp. Gp1-AA117]